MAWLGLAVPPLPLPALLCPCCAKANAALINNLASPGWLPLPFSLPSTNQATGVCQDSSGSAELSHVSTTAAVFVRQSSVMLIFVNDEDL